MDYETERIAYIDRVTAWFGIGDLQFNLTRGERQRLIYASVLPSIVILAEIILLGLQAFKGIPYVDYFNGLDGSIPDRASFWWHFYTATESVRHFAVPLSVVGLLLFSIYPVTRSLASYGFVVAIVLTSVALALFAYVNIVNQFKLSSSSLNTLGLLRDWYLGNALQATDDTIILAGGYAFLAFRGLSRRELPRGRRVRVPPPQPRESL